MTATMLPALPSFGAMGLGLQFGPGPSANRNDALPVLPPVGALLSMPMMRPVVRARSADDVAPLRPKKATPALAQFAADWNRLPRTHARFADGAAILQKVNPRNVDSKAVEMLPQNLNTEATQGNNSISVLLRSSELDLVQTELENLTQDRCVCAAGPGADLRAIPDELERGEPLVVGVHTPLGDGLGAIVAPIRLPQPQQNPSAVVMGSGAIARTTTPLHTPVLTRQVVGRTLVVHWVPVSRMKIPHGTSFVSATSRMMSGATLRSVVLASGQWCVLPKGSVYVTLALGDNDSKFAAQVKFAIHLPSSMTSHGRARVGEKRKADNGDDGYESQSSYSGSYAGSYAGSVNHDSDIEDEKDCDNCSECRAARSFKRARTADDDDRNDYDATTTPTADYTVTRTRDSFDNKNQYATASPHLSPYRSNSNSNLSKHNTMY